MPKVIKFSGTPLSKTRGKGNMRIGANSHDYGTSYYSMIEPPDGGYTVYENKASGGPSIRVANNETELINLTRESSGTTYTSAAECLAWFATQTDKLVVSSNDAFDDHVTDGLILDLNAANLASYPTTYSNWYSLDGTLGSEMIQNGDFSNGTTYWGRGSGGGTPTFDVVFDSEENKNVLRLKSGGGWGMYIHNNMNSSMSTNKTYLLTIRYKNDNISAGQCDIGEGFVPSDYLNTLGEWTTYQAIVLGNLSSTTFSKIHNRNTSYYLYISSVSFKEITGLRLLNNPTFNSNGFLDFDGVDDIAACATAIDTGGSFSIEVTAKNDTMDTNGSNRQTVWGLNTGTNGYQLLDLEIWGDIPYSFNGDGTNYTGGPVQLKNSTISSTNWHTYTLSSNNGVWTWYIDGTQIHSYTPTYTGTSKYFQLGARGNGYAGTGQIWNGKFASAKIYNKALSESEIKQNYYGAVVPDNPKIVLNNKKILSFENNQWSQNMTGLYSNTNLPSGYISHNDLNGDFDGLTEFTYCLWLKVHNVPVGYSHSAFNKYAGTTTAVVRLYQFGTTSGSSNLFKFYVNGGGAWGDVGGGYYGTNGETFFMVIQYNSTDRGQLWINGQKVGSRGGRSGTIASNTANFYIYPENGTNTNSTVKEAYVYNHELTDQEILTLFNSTRGNHGI